jgi:mediator of RNA polymerase II transcription subunit 10
MAQHTQAMLPIQILADMDNSRNPMQLTKERLERAATENQFMNGKIAAIDVRSPASYLYSFRLNYVHLIQSYHKYLDEALAQSFPELGPHLRSSQKPNSL